MNQINTYKKRIAKKTLFMWNRSHKTGTILLVLYRKDKEINHYVFQLKATLITWISATRCA